MFDNAAIEVCACVINDTVYVLWYVVGGPALLYYSLFIFNLFWLVGCKHFGKKNGGRLLLAELEVCFSGFLSASMKRLLSDPGLGLVMLLLFPLDNVKSPSCTSSLKP